MLQKFIVNSFKKYLLIHSKYISYNAIPQHNYIYLFKSGKVTVNDIDDDDIFWNELDRDDENFMEVTTQTLADGREHHLMFVKIPYTYWKDDPKVSGFVRLRYVLD